MDDPTMKAQMEASEKLHSTPLKPHYFSHSDE
jgi:hypothetical protein